MKRTRLVWLPLLAGLPCCRDQAAAPPRAPVPRPLVALRGKPEGTVRRIVSGTDVPLRGPRVDGRPGDFLLRAGELAAVVSAEGLLVDFGRQGGQEELVGLEPAVFAALERRPLSPARVTAEGAAVRVERTVLDAPLRLRTWFYLSRGGVVVESTLTNEGPGPSAVLTLGEHVAWGNVPTWIAGHGFARRAGSYSGDFIAREHLDTSYALCSAAGRIAARIPTFDLEGFHADPVTGEVAFALAPGETYRRIVRLGHSRRSSGHAAQALGCTRGVRRWSLPAAAPPGTRVEVERCEAPGAPYLVMSLEAGARDVTLPDGCLRVRLVARGHAPGDWMTRSGDAPEGWRPRAGRLRWDVGMPARLLVRGVGRTPDPDWGEGEGDGAARNVIYSDRGTGEIALPPGRYRVTVSRGFEYSHHEEEVDVLADRAVTVRARLSRVVDTTGWIAADLHLHARPSPDAPTSLEDRIRSLAAVGVEVGVATDHNAVTDYRPAIQRLGLGRHVASVIGDEVTTKGVLLGHFNVFPLEPNSPPIEWRHTLPHRIFTAARSARPLGPETILQVNHPRMRDLGYFEILRFDPGGVKRWLERTPLAQMGFDAIEVFNGDHYAKLERVEECLRDWYALLDAGRRYTATGNSDSHKLTYHEAGVPRNLVWVGDDDPSRFDERTFVRAIRSGQVVVSSGPFVTMRAAGRPVGSTVPPGETEVEIEVQAPEWVDVDRVELVRRGAVWRTWRGPFAAGPRRFHARVRVPLAAGDWIVALARGTRPMTLLYRPGARPFAFTNPIFVGPPPGP